MLSNGNVSCAINYWGDSVANLINPLTPVEKTLALKELIFDLTERKCMEKNKKWNELGEDEREVYRLRKWI